MQSFEYILTPLTPGLIEVPPVEFSFFDPIQEMFFSSDTPTHPLRVDPGEKWTSGNPDNIGSPGKDEETKTATADLFQTESEPGEWVNALEQSLLFENPVFWYFQSIPLLSFCALIFWGTDPKEWGKGKIKAKGNRPLTPNEGFRRVQRCTFLSQGLPGSCSYQVGIFEKPSEPLFAFKR